MILSKSYGTMRDRQLQSSTAKPSAGTGGGRTASSLKGTIIVTGEKERFFFFLRDAGTPIITRSRDAHAQVGHQISPPWPLLSAVSVKYSVYLSPRAAPPVKGVFTDTVEWGQFECGVGVLWRL